MVVSIKSVSVRSQYYYTMLIKENVAGKSINSLSMVNDKILLIIKDDWLSKVSNLTYLISTSINRLPMVQNTTKLC
jgi:hypothetical protein